MTAPARTVARSRKGRPIQVCSSCGDQAPAGRLLCRPCARAKQLEPGRTRAP